VAALRGDRFELYLPDLQAVVEAKTADPDTFLAGLSQLRRRPT
jgi:hypothetical protein